MPVYIVPAHTVLGELKGKFDRIICDPPFLSQDCQTKGEYFLVLPKAPETKAVY